jgi:DNA-binding NarL/FixJ family response regulator
MLPHKNTISVAIIDDHPIVMEGLQKILEKDPQFKVEGCYTLGLPFLDMIKKEPDMVDIVLMDINLPDINGVVLCKEIKIVAPEIIVLTFSNYNERSIIMQVLQNGANGYLLKNAAADELIACIHEAIAGQIAFSAEVKKIIARPRLHDLKAIPSLTSREKEILKYIAEGQTSAAIAKQLSLSQLTIETHRRNLMQKFEAKNVATLIKLATQYNLV